MDDATGENTGLISLQLFIDPSLLPFQKIHYPGSDKINIHYLSPSSIKRTPLPKEF